MIFEQKFKNISDFKQYITTNFTNFNLNSDKLVGIYEKSLKLEIPILKTKLFNMVKKDILVLIGRNSCRDYWKTRLWGDPDEKLRLRQSKSGMVAILKGSHKGRFSEKWFINKYGAIGIAKYIEFKQMRSDRNKREYQIEKMGLDAYNARIASSTATLENFIKKNGLENGEKKYTRFLELSVNTKDNFIKRHGVEAGEYKWGKYLADLKHAHSEAGWIEKYGEIGVQKREEFFKRTIWKGCQKFSTKSKKLFDMVTEECSLKNALYAENEKFLSINGKRYWPDFLYKNKIIEFYGDYWHCNPARYKSDEYIKFPNKNYIKACDKWESDRIRESVLKESGYDILVVWEKDFMGDSNNTIKKCVRFIDN